MAQSQYLRAELTGVCLQIHQVLVQIPEQPGQYVNTNAGGEIPGIDRFVRQSGCIKALMALNIPLH